jgi:hypothetical protein
MYIAHGVWACSVAEAIGVGVFSAGEGDSEAFSVMEKLEKYMSDTPKEVSVPCCE